MNRLRSKLIASAATVVALTAAVTGALAAPAAADPPVPTELTATVDLTTVDLGQNVSITGTIRKLTETGWVDVPGAHIHARHCADPSCSTSWGGASTLSQPGGWRIGTAPPRTGFYRVTFQAWNSPATSDLAVAVVDVPQVNVLQPTNNSTITAARQPSGDVRFYAALGFPSYVLPPTVPVARVEFSTDNTTWTTAATVTARYFHNGTYVYEAYVTEPLSGYWRGVYDGLPTAAKASTTGATHVT
ncbi:hypothetical protein [Saccharothrix sp. Mg75]|uniref:hypothetical protein n=1 Tax=Saccharothrix sp. Mg75 TaxID=3445357 RepID=UPI003EEDDC5B